MDELERVVVAAPCPISWELMPGNERVRYCSSCSKNVYNISDMTSKEAQQFLEENGTSQCVRLFRRQDGKVMTDNCPLGLRAIRNRCRLVVRMLAGCAASLLAFVPSFRNQASAQEQVPYDGEPAMSTKDLKRNTEKPDQSKKTVKETSKDAGKDSGKDTGKDTSKVSGKDAGKVSGKDSGISKPTGPAPSMPPSAGLIALPEKETTTNKKQIMVGGDVCPGSDQVKSNAPSHGFKMGKMAAPRINPLNPKQNTSPNTPPQPKGKDEKDLGPKASLPGVQIEVIDTRDFSSLSLAEYTEKSENGGFERDSRAYNMYQKARQSEASGRLLVAQAQYKEAIASAKQQNGGDPKFLEMLTISLAALQEKLEQSPTQSF